MMTIKHYVGSLVGVALAGALTVGAIVACSPASDKPKGVPVVPEFNGDIPPPKSIKMPAFDWHIVSEAEMQAIYKRSGKVVPEGGILMGFEGVNEEGRQVVVTGVPKYVDDQITCTLGHEVMHIAFGDYHK